MTSQDTLVAHLRTTHICPSRECEAAADALEAQAARITELEAHNRRLATTMTGDTATDLRVLYAYELGLADHTLTTPTEETL